MTMIAGVLSDTHFSDLAEADAAIGELLAGCFADVDLVLHAGDLGPPEALFCFAPLPVLAVRGNTDTGHADLPSQRLLTLDGVRIGLVHGWGAAAGLETRVIRHFDGQELDLLIFGHSHVPVCTRRNGLLLFNPGSLNRPRSSRGPTVGRLILDRGTVSGEILTP
ncbi:metallophosphoesterase [Geothermobacter hydrogeniphilus]|uniref:Phosphoesterase n=1 Tax=Geothermobacter hydrogeniphilus TaxID=1969733 RepID=A0A2K2H6E0_9BACT|nr:metallophosphoesterase family protein [Geothermobacter hydrogeniphilus]PNU18809.1 metallophosphoesterase [Geothermobacter hydrogeniphilus]